MRCVLRFGFAFALSLVLMAGCSEDSGEGGSGGTAGMGGGGTGGAGGMVSEAIEAMLVGRWWLDWDQAIGDPTPDGMAIATFSEEGWMNYDVQFPTVSPPIPDWCRRYASWSLSEVVSETEFGYEQTYTDDTCNRSEGWIERFKVVLDQMDPPKGQVTRLISPEYPQIGLEWTLPIERCTTDINASVACGLETGLGPPAQNPGGGGAGGSGGTGGGAGGAATQ
jgi:hypothetical protein